MIAKAEEKTVSAQFQDLVWDAEKIGLRQWLQMDVEEFRSKLPSGPPADLSNASDEDRKTAQFMLKAAARGKGSLLDFDFADPGKLLHDFEDQAESVKDELRRLPENPYLKDSAIEELIPIGRHAAPRTVFDQEGPALQQLLEREVELVRKQGPVQWKGDNFQSFEWITPERAVFDPNRNVYVREQAGVDPNLNLNRMRQYLFRVNRMLNMTKDGRAFYYRAMVLVGNGQGLYGFGVGFGQTPKTARAAASLQALRKLEFIDHDEGRVMTTPVFGREYRGNFYITPRPLGKGLVAKTKRYYPWMYILGLDNARVNFKGRAVPWFTRIKALKRALDMIQSRKTLSAATGKKHALLVAPGDHWVHWPDKWFDHLRFERDEAARKVNLMRKHALNYKHRSHVVVYDKEITPGWTSDWQRKGWTPW